MDQLAPVARSGEAPLHADEGAPEHRAERVLKGLGLVTWPMLTLGMQWPLSRAAKYGVGVVMSVMSSNPARRADRVDVWPVGSDPVDLRREHFLLVRSRLRAFPSPEPGGAMNIADELATTESLRGGDASSLGVGPGH